jgi:hypothetical protein
MTFIKLYINGFGGGGSPRQLPSKSFPIYDWSIILPFSNETTDNFLEDTQNKEKSPTLRDATGKVW